MTTDTSPKNNGFKIEIICSQAEIDALGSALDELATAIAAFEIVPGGDWRLEAYCTEEPSEAEVTAALGIELVKRGFRILPLPAVDWLAENRKSFPAQDLGRFYIYGSHITEPIPVNRIGLLVEAATAFGSGEHPTTRLCLAAIVSDHKRWRRVPRVVDIGTGSGILSLALARLGCGRRSPPIIASDIDHQSVLVAADNAKLNRVGARIGFVTAAGYGHRLIRRHAPYDLIVSNILARPLCRLAPDLARHLALGGRVILSGLLVAQEAQVIAAHRTQGLALVSRQRRDGWSALVFKRRGG
ncbi:MAG: 50S ribosomal protein L11 methyltransferase [Candidatus Pacebacteria bacterium]|nr:50S ribosomal protein L11 methyltransferase [Candidatus Paceibacterota bacterium]